MSFAIPKLRYYKNLLRDRKEYCGYFIEHPTDRGSILLDYYPQPYAGKLINPAIEEIPACVHKDGYKQFMWHTHPNVVLSTNELGIKNPTITFPYPSGQDIKTVMKHREVQCSIIFTILGIWVIQCTDHPDAEDLQNPQKEKILLDWFKNLFHDFHYAVKGTTTITPEAHAEYLNIRREINDRFPYLTLKFYHWPKHDFLMFTNNV